MRYYADLLKLRCFTKAAVAALTHSSTAAGLLLTQYRKRGYVDQVRRDLWVVLGLEDHQPVASRYRIATAINPESCVSHHSAFEYHGYANQVSYEVCVSSAQRFTPFDYDGVSYRWFAPRIDAGMEKRPDAVTVTNIERASLDSINDFEKVGGLEELLTSLEMLPYLDPAQLLSYLTLYDKQMLYQKPGYLLSQFNQTLRLPETFFAECEAKIGKSVRYLAQDQLAADKIYDRRWHLVVPRRLTAVLTQGVS